MKMRPFDLNHSLDRFRSHNNPWCCKQVVMSFVTFAKRQHGWHERLL